MSRNQAQPCPVSTHQSASLLGYGQRMGRVLVGLWLLVLAMSNGEGSTSPGDWLERYFEVETARIEGACLNDAGAVEDFVADRERYRRQLFQMLGLWPMPERTALEPVVTGRIKHPDFTIEKLHFQSMPRLYVTGNLYVPRDLSGPAPAILYVCGHAQVKTNGVSCGNKTAYQHHGIWFARHGYVCLILDTVQLGEIEGLHHGTYREGMWWWNSRGYTPAGVEAWNSIRGLDYLQSRSEVDPERIGMTGRSGGGAYSWTTAALDERVRVVAPVAGITDLRNQVVDGCVAGHCDCMFIVNQYQWDYPMLAALVAPRPLLIVNTDADGIFPLDGVIRTHSKLRQVYQAYGAATNLGLVMAPGPHRDTQDLQVPVFRWFNQHLKGDDPPIEIATVKLFDPWDLRVFDVLPTNAINAHIHESFVPTEPRPAEAAVRARLRADTFGGWPADESSLELWIVDDRRADSLRLRVLEFRSQPGVRLRLFVVEPQGPLRETVMTVLDEREWTDWEARMDRLFSPGPPVDQADNPGEPPAVAVTSDEAEALAERLSAEGRRWVIVLPRGIGPTAWQANDREEVQIRRRFMLLGQTLEGMRVWDIRQAVRAWKAWEGSYSAAELTRGREPADRDRDRDREPGQQTTSNRPTQLGSWEGTGGDVLETLCSETTDAQERVPTVDTRLMVVGRGTMGVNVLYAALFTDEIAELRLSALPASHELGPDYLNVLKITDVPRTLEMVRERIEVRVEGVDAGTGGLWPLLLDSPGRGITLGITLSEALVESEDVVNAAEWEHL